MPNQRKRGKKLVGAFMPEAEKKMLEAAAERKGLTLADLVRQLIDKHLEDRKYKNATQTNDPIFRRR